MGYTGPGGVDSLYVGSTGVLSTEHAIFDPQLSKIVRLTRDQFLTVLDNAKPEAVYRGKSLHFIYYDQFIVVTFECTDSDFTQPIESIDIEWRDEPDVVPMKPTARHYLQNVGAIDFLTQLGDERASMEQTIAFPKVDIDTIDALIHCPRCETLWNEAPQTCPNCHLTLYDHINLPKTWYGCLTCSKRIYNYEVQLQRNPEGYITMLCPYCHKDLQNQSKTSAVIHWIKYPLLIFVIGLSLWVIMMLLGRDVLFWG